MIDIDPQQELFTAVKVLCEANGFDVYDTFLPPEDTPYPFVYLGEFRLQDEANKSAVFGYVYPTIYVWSNKPKERGAVSQMLLEIKSILRNLERTPNFKWDLRNITQRIIPDTTTKTPLLQGVIEAELYFS